MVKKYFFSILTALLTGFLLSGLILLINSRPDGNPIQIIPAPTASPIQVYITGTIQNPGIYLLEKGSRLSDLISLAGGLTTSEINNLNLAAKLYDGQHINLDEEPIFDESPRSSDVQFSSEIKKININEAGIEELETLPGIGETRAKDIINYRNTAGYFDEIDDILNVKGIGLSTFEKIKDLIVTNQVLD
jgi:competence protein ComEA